VVKQAYGVEASAAARDGPERVQKPTNKRARGATRMCLTRPLRADSRERPATVKILLSKGAEKTVSFPPRPKDAGFLGDTDDIDQ
jgi:hypothetical protein